MLTILRCHFIEPLSLLSVARYGGGRWRKAAEEGGGEGRWRRAVKHKAAGQIDFKAVPEEALPKVMSAAKNGRKSQPVDLQTVSITGILQQTVAGCPTSYGQRKASVRKPSTKPLCDVRTRLLRTSTDFPTSPPSSPKVEVRVLSHC